MVAVIAHENANVQKILDVLAVASLECKEVGKRGDLSGFAIIVDGTQDLEGCRTRFLQTVDALEKRTFQISIRDALFDQALYDSVQIFGIEGKLIHLMLAK